jgi:glutamate 5-kinase
MQKIVLKVGTSSISKDNAICEEKIQNLVSFIYSLRKKYQVILVSSGAVVCGYSILNINKSIENKQALASIGQPKLMSIYDQYFKKHNIITAQLLLTASSFDSRKQTLNARTNINTLLKNNVLPIINENDATVIKEIVFGDNDQLSASVCCFFDCDMLVMLSDIDGYYDKNPSCNDDAKIIKYVHNITDEDISSAPSPNNEFATGGIVTKLMSAKMILEYKKKMFLVNGLNLTDAKSYLLDDIYIKGTFFTPIQ